MSIWNDVKDDPRYVKVHDFGFCGLVDHMGSDERIETAARISYGEGTRNRSDTRSLIRYLMRHKHTSPFEMCEVCFHIRMPIFVMRQWVRHRTANLNEYSGRYSVMLDEFYVPSTEYIRGQSKTNKQGRSEALDESIGKAFQTNCHMTNDEAHSHYKWALSEDIARELARIDLPLSTYTELYWKIDLHNLFHLLKLRLHPHAQQEIRDFAQACFSLTEPLFPLSFEAWRDYVQDAETFSKQELLALYDMITYRNGYDTRVAQLPDPGEYYNMSAREWAEFQTKLGSINIA